MPKSCSAFNCTSRYSSQKRHVTFHRFPLSKPSVLKEWLENIGREDLQPKKHMVICSHHFTPDCFSSSGNRKNLLWNAVPTLFTSPPPNAKRRKCRKRIKCKAAHVLPKWEQLLLKVPGSESEKEGLGENAAGINNAMEEHQSSALQHLPPIDHNYALPSRCAARTRLFSAMDTIGWLHRKLKVKCQELQRMRLKLCACRKELASFRGRCLVSARLRFDQNGVA